MNDEQTPVLGVPAGSPLDLEVRARMAADHALDERVCEVETRLIVVDGTGRPDEGGKIGVLGGRLSTMEKILVGVASAALLGLGSAFYAIYGAGEKSGSREQRLIQCEEGIKDLNKLIRDDRRGSHDTGALMPDAGTVASGGHDQ